MDPVTGLEVTGINWDMLIRRAYEERKANSVPIGLEFEDSVEADLCKNYPSECDHFDGRTSRVRHITFGDVVRGTSVLLKFKLGGSKTVPQDEANRRAQICSTCKWNVAYAKPCTGICAELQHIITSLVGNKSTPYDEVNRACYFCGCFVAAMVHLPLETQCMGVTDDMKEEYKLVPNCWKQCP